MYINLHNNNNNNNNNNTIVGVQQLLPTKVYYNRKTKSQVTDEKCRLCEDSLVNVQHIGYLAVVHWHRLSTYRDITMLSRYYSLKTFDI